MIIPKYIIFTLWHRLWGEVVSNMHHLELLGLDTGGHKGLAYSIF